MSEEALSFWDHLDVLRKAIVKCIFVALIFAVVAFFFKDEVFAIILAPQDSAFITYRMLNSISGIVKENGPDDFYVKIINTGLAQQFMIHMKIALCVGVICASPYILYQLFRFVSPALYADERNYAIRIAGGGYVMFAIGILLTYLMIFPLTFRFLGTYQVSSEIDNMITLESYISTLLTMSIAMGIVFEIPILSWLFAKMGFLTAEFMRKYRKHAFVLILVIAAIITPTSDVITLTVVALPMYLLFELSIILVAHSSPKQKFKIQS